MARIRQNGEGTYYKQKNGTWQYKITIGKDDNGKLIRKTFYGSTGQIAKEKADTWNRKTMQDFSQYRLILNLKTGLVCGWKIQKRVLFENLHMNTLKQYASISPKS